MTREEAIKELQEDIELYIPLHGTINDVERDLPDGRLITALEMAIKALSQECVGSTQKHVGYALDMRCDDAISRQAVLDMWRQEICYDRPCCYRDEGRCTETYCDFKLFEYEINHMPPVKPQEPKTGHWSHDGSHWKNRFICSECGYKLFDEQTNFCPNCGARMIEPQESEEV